MVSTRDALYIQRVKQLYATTSLATTTHATTPMQLVNYIHHLSPSLVVQISRFKVLRTHPSVSPFA